MSELVGRAEAAASAAASEISETSSAAADALSSVVAAVVRAPPKDFRVIRQEWAAVRIQTAFRGFLVGRSRRALDPIPAAKFQLLQRRVSLGCSCRPGGR